MTTIFKFAALLSLVLLVGISFAADPPPVDRDLEKSLDDDLIGELPKPMKKPATPETPAPAPAPATDSTKPAPKPAANPLDRDLEGSLGGEDVELGPAKSPLIKIGERMRIAEKRLAQQDPGPDTQIEQQQAIRDLEMLIDQVEQQQKQQQPKPGGQPMPMPMAQPKPMQNPNPMPGPSEQGTNAANDSVRDSTTRVEEGKVEQGDAKTRVELVRRAWGHLPAKIREQLQSRGVEEFLPQYEQLMEKYFKRLAEEGSGRP